MQEIYSFNFFPEIAAILVFLGIVFVPLYSLWKPLSKMVIIIFTIILLLSTIGTGIFFQLMLDDFAKGDCVKKDPKIAAMLGTIENIKIVKGDLNFGLKVVAKKCLVSSGFDNKNNNSLNVDLKIIAYNVNNQLVFESKVFNSNVDNFTGRSKLPDDIQEMFIASKPSLVDFFTDVQVVNNFGTQEIIYEYSNLTYTLVTGERGGREAFSIDIGCKSNVVKRIDYEVQYPAESYSIVGSYHYIKKSTDLLFQCAK